MSTQHTPGPWIEIDGGTAIWSETFQTNTPIAKVNRRLDGTTQANARLIAAAPELLEALKSTHSMLQAALFIMDDPEARAIAMKQLEANRAAIAKHGGAA